MMDRVCPQSGKQQERNTWNVEARKSPHYNARAINGKCFEAAVVILMGMANRGVAIE